MPTPNSAILSGYSDVGPRLHRVAVFRAARAEATALGHRYLATEHLLLGLLSEPRAPIAALLAASGFHLSEARARIRWILEGDPRDPTSYVPATAV